MILGTVLDDGRIYTYSLLFFALLICFGFLIQHRSGHAELVAAGAGVLSHQVLDLMWKQPSNWLCPFVGSFLSSGHVPDYFLVGFIHEISSPAEWIWGFVFLVVLFFYLRRSHEHLVFYRQEFMMAVWVLTPVTGLIGLYAIICGIAGAHAPLTGMERSKSEYNLGHGHCNAFVAEVRYAAYLKGYQNDCTK